MKIRLQMCFSFSGLRCAVLGFVIDTCESMLRPFFSPFSRFLMNVKFHLDWSRRSLLKISNLPFSPTLKIFKCLECM